MRAVSVLLLAFLLGAIPFSNLVAHGVARTDLREVGTGTVSGTGLYHVAGFVPLVVGGLLDIAKAVPAVLAAGDRPVLAAGAATLAVIGHNWSPFLGFAGGRGLSTAMGAYLVIAWPAVVVILGGLAVGRLLRHTGLATFMTICALPVVLAVTSGGDAVLASLGIGIVQLLKRIAGNAPLPDAPSRSEVVTRRLLYDNDG